MTDVNIFVAFAAGVFSFLSPCVLPLIPSYLSFVSGVSLEEMRSDRAEARERWRVVLNSVAFIIGFSLVFVSLGASASLLGALFLSYRNAIRVIGGIFILLVGLYLVGLFKIAALERYLQFNLKDKPAGYAGSVLVGITFAVAWTPCVGPILGAILTVSTVQTSASGGVGLLATYAAGLGVPFLLTALFTRELAGRLRALRRLGTALQIVAGVILIVMGVAMVTGQLSRLGFWLLETFPVFQRIG